MMGRLYTVSGPAGVGKGTLVDLACAMDPSLFLSISCTTREVRPGEKDGVNYHYISEARFDQMVREDAFFEWVSVHGHRYGTPCEPVERALAAGRSAILEIDVQGSAQVKLRRSDTIRIFVLPPSWQALKSRLISRARDPLKDVAVRLKNAYHELEEGLKFDYAIENGEREAAARDLLRVIRAEDPEEFALARQRGKIEALLNGYEEVETIC